MAYTTIDDPSVYFQTTLYTGTGSGLSVTNSGNSNLKPDWVWVKDRGATNDHKLTDSMRLNSSNQPTLTLESNTSAAEYDDSGEGSDATTSFNTDGFTIGTNGNYNTDGNTYVAWQWKANGGTASGSFNESGNNPGVSFQANTTAGFSICTYTGTGGNGSFAHGLGVIPQWVIFKARAGTENWPNYHVGTGNTHAVELNRTNAPIDNATLFQDTTPTNSSVYIGTDSAINADGVAYVAYCFAPIQGYSKFGTYEGNGNADGTFVYLGFKPAWLMVRNIDEANVLQIYDNKRELNNPNIKRINTDVNSVESTSGSDRLDFLSNGFKMRATSGNVNAADTYIYMAFAESPFVSSKGIPTTAR